MARLTAETPEKPSRMKRRGWRSRNASHQQRNSKGNTAVDSIERFNPADLLSAYLPYTVHTQFNEPILYAIDVVVRVRFRLFVVFLMRRTALPRFGFVVAISMRDAGLNVGQRVLLIVPRVSFSVVFSLMRLLVSHPVV